MNRRMKKKEWKAQTEARTNDLADLLERVDALEKQAQAIIAEQTAQRERTTDVQEQFELYTEAHARRHKVEDERRIRQERIRMEHERERRQKRQEWAKLGALAAFAVSFACFAITFPAPERTETARNAEPTAVVACPVEDVAVAMAVSWEG